jgi:hypothetical protein
MLDLLWAPERCLVTMTKYWKNIIDHRDLFMSKRCRHTFSGYAMAQLLRIKVARRFLLNPPKIKPTRELFDLPPTSIFPTAQLKAIIYSALGDFLIPEDKENFLAELDDIYSDYIIPVFRKYTKEDRRTLALEYLQVGIKSQANTLKSLGPSYIKDEYLEEADKELRYYHADKEWDQFEDWKKHRNKARAELEIKHGYDCYSYDTEFLTQEGWKTYENISFSNKLATLKMEDSLGYKLNNGKRNPYNKIFGIEYQHYVDRFEGLYTGTMYNFIGNHMNILVTPNHRMLFRPVEKNNKVNGKFILEEAFLLPNCFDFLRTITPKIKPYENPSQLKGLPITAKQFLSLMGWYLSEGCMGKRNNKLKNVRISQKKKGRLHWFMSRFHNSVKNKIGSGLYIYDRKPNVFNPFPIKEVVLTVTDKIIRERIFECGELKNKKIPRWIFNLSKVLKETLLQNMLLGDGTIRNTSFKSWIFYTSLKNLADDVQELALTCGWETSLYGPYDGKDSKGRPYIMYQVHLNKNVTQFDRLARSINLKKIEVENQRIVCFTVPNRTLITRRKGHVAFHGNSKHAMHLVRLYRMGKEILETGIVNVDRTNIDAEELKDIRKGVWKYEQVEEYSKAMDKELETIYHESKLQKYPKFEEISNLCVDTCKEYFKESPKNI